MNTSLIRSIVRRLPLPPIEVVLEPTKLCNLKCDRCRRLEGESIAQIARVGNHFTPDQFKEVLDKLRHIRIANWVGDGEPLLNPDFNKLIEMSAQKGIKTRFSTNGMLVTKEDVDFWKKHKVADVQVSLDTSIPETFERMRPGATFDRVIKTCKLITEAGILLQLSNIPFAESIEDMPKYVDLCIELGVWKIGLPRPHLYGTLKKYLPSYPDPVVANPILKIAKDKARKAKIGWYEPWLITSYFKRCMYPFLAPYIQIGGTIQTCCFISGKDRIGYYDGVAYKVPSTSYEMGNILTDDFGKIWHGEAYKEIRGLLIKSERPVGSTIEPEQLHALKRNTSSRFSHCLGCGWRWGIEC